MAQQPQYNSEPEYHTDIPVGEILRRTRIHYNQSLMEVEANLRIRGSQIQAIEEGDFNAMPGRVYAIGFVRAYSEYLGLDGDKMVELFKNQYAAFRNRPTLNFPVTMAETKMPSPYIIMGSLVLGILLIVIWSIFMLPNHQRESIPEVPVSLMQTSLPVINVTNTEAIDVETPEEDALIAPQDNIQEDVLLKSSILENRVELVVLENSWTDIRNEQGDAVLRQILKPGEKYTVPEDGQTYTMSTGNAGGVTVFIGGKKVGKLGDAAQVKRNIPLSAQDLRSYVEAL